MKKWVCLTRWSKSISLAPLLLLAVILPACHDEGETEAPLPEDFKAIAVKAAEKLRIIGYDVNLDQLKFAVKDKEGSFDDCDRTQDMFFRPGHFEEMSFLMHALGALPEDDPAALRRATINELSKVLQAYYQIDQDTLVFLDTQAGELGRILAGLELIVTHELVHAYQDQVHDLEKVLANNNTSLEGVRILGCIMEGEAEWASMGTLLGEEQLMGLEPEALESEFESFMSGDYAIIYQAGRKFMAHQYQQGGWKAVQGCLTEPPDSTEQVLHPEKLGKDLPVTVRLPDFGLEVLHEDTMGELQIYLLMTAMGLKRTEVYPAVAGWDGDRVQILADSPGHCLAVWRIVWDRDEDAEQFAALMSGQPGVIARRGCTVDWYSEGASADTISRVEEKLAAWVQDVGEDAARDGESTRLVEEAWQEKLANRPKVEGEAWVHSEAGIEIVIPEGWEVKEVKGQQMLMKQNPSVIGFSSNINVQVVPMVQDMTIEAWMEMNQKQLEGMPALHLVYQGKAKVSGRDVVSYEMKGKIGASPELHFLGLAYFRDRKQVIVTATTMETMWDTFKPVFEKALLGLKIQKTN